MKFEAPRGTHDILPSEQPLWDRATGELERLCALYGYRRIQTPVFEDLAAHPTALRLVRSVLGKSVLLGNLSANITGPGGGEITAWPSFFCSGRDSRSSSA